MKSKREELVEKLQQIIVITKEDPPVAMLVREVIDGVRHMSICEEKELVDAAAPVNRIKGPFEDFSLEDQASLDSSSCPSQRLETYLAIKLTKVDNLCEAMTTVCERLDELERRFGE